MEHSGCEEIEFCSSCHVGKLRASRTTYAHWHGDEFIVVPGLPAWRCDYCGDAFFDNDALTQLVLLLGTESMLEAQRWPRTTGLEKGGENSLGEGRRA